MISFLFSQQQNQFSTAGAYSAWQREELDDWVHEYLRSGSWANDRLSVALKQRQRYWVAPVRLEFWRVLRDCGPEEEMTYRKTPEQWEQKVSMFMHSIRDAEILPPLIVNTHDGSLRAADDSFRFIIVDGAHRFEALRRLGNDSFWFLVWFESPEQRLEFLLRHNPEFYRPRSPRQAIGISLSRRIGKFDSGTNSL